MIKNIARDKFYNSERSQLTILQIWTALKIYSPGHESHWLADFWGYIPWLFFRLGKSILTSLFFTIEPGRPIILNILFKITGRLLTGKWSILTFGYNSFAWHFCPFQDFEINKLMRHFWHRHIFKQRDLRDYLKARAGKLCSKERISSRIFWCLFWPSCFIISWQLAAILIIFYPLTKGLKWHYINSTNWFT